MRVEAYIASKVPTPVVARALSNLAYASIHANHEITASNKPAIDQLLERLRSKLGAVAGPEAPQVTAPVRPPRPVAEESSGPMTHAKALLAGIDPATGEKLERVCIGPGAYVLYNAGTRVVHPIPVSDSVPSVI